MPEIRPARPSDDHAAARLIYLAAGGMYDIYAGGRHRSHALIRAALERPGVGASRETVTVAEIDRQVVGVLSAFPASEAKGRDNRFVWLALRRLPPWRWPRILRIELAASGVYPEPPEGSLYVDTLATDERFRRRGVASALLEAANDQARALGLTKVSLDTTERNAAARALYERHGFRVVQHVPAINVIPPEVIYVRELA